MMVTYGYSAGRVTSLTVNGTPLLTAIAYEPFGPVSGWTFGNGTAFDRTFDLDGRLKSQTFGAGTRSYSFDAASRITKFTDPSHNLTFTYDVLDRLIKSTGTFGRTYAYDANGNRVLDKKGTTQTDYVTDTSSNRLLSTTSAAVTNARVYDAAGNTLNDGTYSYVYDARGRLVESRNASDAIIGSYKVNALGQRVYKKRGTAVTHFVYDEAGHLIGEYNGAGTLVQETLYLGDTPVGVWKAGVLYFIHADHLNTPRAILDQSNRVIWLWKAEPFGSQAATQNPDGDTVTFAYNLRFPGQYFDQETGLFYNYFRDYDPRIGRYATSDPIGLAGGINTYTYVGNNPLNFVDSLGLQAALPVAVIPPAVGGPSAGGNNLENGAGSGTISLPIPNLLCIGARCFPVPVYSEGAFPPGVWPGDKGAAEWGRRNGVGAREGKGRFHGIKQNCGGRGKESFGVNPETGDVYDPAGDVVGNLGDVKSK